jgi:hypothetical protein
MGMKKEDASSAFSISRSQSRPGEMAAATWKIWTAGARPVFCCNSAASSARNRLSLPPECVSSEEV